MRSGDARGFTPPPRGARGFTVVGVVVAIAILTILIAAVGPTISTIIQRDKETELIFRGKQYARAIVAFQKRYGRYPNELKELSEVKPKSIRKLFREPMCNCDEWQDIIAGSPEAVPMGQGGPALPGGGLPGQRTPRPGTTPGTGGNQPPSTYTGMGGPTPPPFLGGGGGAPTPTPAPFSTGIFANHDNKTIGPIVGVRSRLHHKALKKWRDKEWYDEWRFIAGDADNDDKGWFDPNSLRGPHFTPSPGRP
jgi:type II secretory pathway pseudopilin PulG